MNDIPKGFRCPDGVSPARHHIGAMPTLSGVRKNCAAISFNSDFIATAKPGERALMGRLKKPG